MLRLDSPGGSARASDLLWIQLMELRRAKPLIVSIGDMAASGGYYMACTGTRIFAQSTSVIGSIGVVAGKFAVPRGLDHIGVSVETIAPKDAPGAAARAAYLSPLMAWDEETRKRVMQTVRAVYELFVTRVAEGRGISQDKVAQFAEGRIFAASDGLKLGMVDELGGLQAAIAYARRAGNLEPDAPVRILGDESGLEKLFALEEDSDLESQADETAPALLLRALLKSTAPDLAGFVRAYEPLVQGERTLVAVPFALLIR
ncbi:MAG: S49 family peptidase [Polyangiaceae bacterium]|nr:S49 family peptidase [Polyangiaceae bacterium]